MHIIIKWTLISYASCQYSFGLFKLVLVCFYQNLLKLVKIISFNTSYLCQIILAFLKVFIYLEIDLQFINRNQPPRVLSRTNFTIYYIYMTQFITSHFINDDLNEVIIEIELSDSMPILAV